MKHVHMLYTSGLVYNTPPIHVPVHPSGLVSLMLKKLLRNWEHLRLGTDKSTLALQLHWPVMSSHSPPMEPAGLQSQATMKRYFAVQHWLPLSICCLKLSAYCSRCKSLKSVTLKLKGKSSSHAFISNLGFRWDTGFKQARLFVVLHWQKFGSVGMRELS